MTLQVIAYVLCSYILFPISTGHGNSKETSSIYQHRTGHSRTYSCFGRSCNGLLATWLSSSLLFISSFLHNTVGLIFAVVGAATACWLDGKVRVQYSFFSFLHNTYQHLFSLPNNLMSLYIFSNTRLYLVGFKISL